MFKILLSIILFTNFFISICFSEIIKKVQVQGNQRISDDTIIVLGNIKLNTEYDDEKLNTTLKNLY